MTELNKVLEYKGFKEEFEKLKNTTLTSLPNDVETFVTKAQAYQYDNNTKEINRYHLYNEVFTELRHTAALVHFRKNVENLIIDDERIIEVYIRLEEDWVSNFENATREIEEFTKFTSLLSL